MVEETNLDMQANVYESVEETIEPELYQALETSVSAPKVERRRCKYLPCKNLFFVFLTATVFGTLTGVVILFYIGASTIAVHGGWTSWTDWSACSVTCGVGIQGRHRNCSNPEPNRFGDHCFGESLNVQICTPGQCEDGGWSDWGKWSTCTVTCGGGIQSRSRTCTNPRPSPHGKYCEGDPMEVVLCNKVTCSPNIVFNAVNVTDKSPNDGQTIIFGTTLVNEGNAYNTSTGVFTAPVNGTYSFSTQLCVYVQKYLTVAIIVDGATYATAYIYHDKDSHACNTADTVAVLHEQSKVWVKCTGASSGDVIVIISSYYLNSFSGFLVHQ